MDREFLDLIKKTEAEAAAVIEEAKIKAAEIEKEGERNAEELGSGTRAEWAKLKETKLGEAKYKVKKIYSHVLEHTLSLKELNMPELETAISFPESFRLSARQPDQVFSQP